MVNAVTVEALSVDLCPIPVPTKPQKKIRNGEYRDNTWYALLTVPKDVRHIIGRGIRFVESTQTGSYAQASIRIPLLVAGWRDEIAKARGRLPAEADDFWSSLRQQYLQSNGEDLQLAIEDVAEAEASKVSDPEEASLLYRIATGHAPARVPLGPLVTAWKDSLRLAQKTIDQQHRDVSRMAEHFKYLPQLTPQNVKAWTDSLIAGGMTSASLERIGNGCKSFWTYLQLSGAKEMIDPDPFVGAFKLARRVAKTTDTGRSGSSYTPEELAALYAAALANQDRSLADLIALGAYTGARIEELCQLTKATASGGVLSIGKSKTEAGIRDCPIHPAVAPLVARLIAASKDGFLVPSTARNKYGNRSGPLSQRFGHLKTSMGFGRSHVFHSTRNTLATVMERAGVPEGVAADIVGHAKKTLTYGLYSSGSAQKQKLKAISMVVYPAPLDAP